MPTLAALGFAGGLLHVVNHALFKGLLFLGAGAVAHATGTREIDHLGGLLKRMPWTGLTFLIGAVAISGLPPLNGFVSELLIYLGAFHGLTSAASTTAVAVLCVIAGLALIGGLAAACFTKAFGIVFLGEPRSEHAAACPRAGAGDAPADAAARRRLCTASGCSRRWRSRAALRCWRTSLVSRRRSCALSVAQAGGGLVLRHRGWRRLALSDRGCSLGCVAGCCRAARSPQTVTWDCGYAQPTPRMQYTASSFAQPLTDLFASCCKLGAA